MVKYTTTSLLLVAGAFTGETTNALSFRRSNTFALNVLATLNNDGNTQSFDPQAATPAAPTTSIEPQPYAPTAAPQEPREDPYAVVGDLPPVATATSSSSPFSLPMVASVFVGTVATYFLNNHNFFNVGPVRASSIVSLYATLLLPEKLAIAACMGTFAGSK